jgi:fido (protein-threonine AMPylation protein)/predicted transcriptional regulator
MVDIREQKILEYVENNPGQSSKAIHEGLGSTASYATVKRVLQKLWSDNLIVKEGEGKSTRYNTSPAFILLKPIELEEYYLKEIDERVIKRSFDMSLLNDVLPITSVFSEAEMLKLKLLQSNYQQNVSKLSDSAYKKEMERLAIDLSWKSSQIEGNTYTLLETERLLLDKETATGKSKEEAVMLINHKETIDFISANPDFLRTITVTKIEEIHSLLIKELSISRNIRNSRVGISGTNYRPLDNEFQIIEALEKTCDLVNKKDNVFEKALLALVLISYIQPFNDGNKRTARIVCNAILMSGMHCPVSFRTVDSITYKKAMLLFYEQNNISKMKEMFISQYEFAVKTYF